MILTKKITSNDFSTNRKMLRKDVLRYCENYANYCQHLVTYFNEPLVDNEVRWLVYLIQRIKLFIKDAPASEKVSPFVGRYQRVLTKLEKIENENHSKNGSRH